MPPSTPQFEIRVFHEDDGPSVVALWKAVFNYSNYAAPDNDPLAIIAHKLAYQRELFFVALFDGQIVGTVMGGYDGHRGWIYSLAVKTELRRHGIGAALVRRVEQALGALGCPKINLQIVASNAATAEFYAKLGYVVEDRVSMGKIVRPADK